MFAMVSYYSCFLLQLLLALSLLDHGYAQRYIGDWCSSSEGAGLCQLIHQCPSVYNALIAGKQPGKPCGFQGSTPIVCCPSKNAPPIPPTTMRPKDGSLWGVVSPANNRRPVNPSAGGRTSSRVCAEYELAANIEPRISGGSPAKSMEFPHMVAVGFNKGSEISWDCAGTLISDRFVLTAAHCTKAYQRGEAQWVRLGSLGSNSGNDKSQLRIIKIIRHPEYRLPLKYNDIALLKLERPVQFNANVMPACLDTERNHPAGEMVVATGWGLTDGYSRSENLLKSELPTVAYSNCARSFSGKSTLLPRGIDDQSQICAGGNGKNSCQGDSGGPLTLRSTTNSRNAMSLPVVVGITSFGQVCGNNAPSVYTRVSFYLPWIESVVWPNN